MPRILQIDITYHSLIRIVVVGAVAFVFFSLRQIVAALLFAVVIASGIEPMIRWFGRRRVPRLVAVLIIYLFAFAFIAGVVYVVVPIIVDEANTFLDSFPRYQRTLLRELRTFQDLPFYSFFSENAEDLILNPPFDLGTIGSGTLDVIFGIFGGILSGIILVVVSFYLASQEHGIEHFLRMVTPLQDEEYALDLWNRSQAKMGQWFRGQALLGLIIGVLVYLALTLLGIPYAFLLALLAAIFEIVPIIGPILAAAPAVFFALLESPILGLIVVITYVVIQQLESHLVVPLVMRRAVGLNPLVIIIALLAGARLGGILGMFLAVPIAAVLVEFLTDTDRKKRGLFQFSHHEAH